MAKDSKKGGGHHRPGKNRDHEDFAEKATPPPVYQHYETSPIPKPRPTPPPPADGGKK